MVNKVSVKSLKAKKQNNDKITMLTAYDYQFAKMISKAGIDIILVGDSLGMVVLGYDNTLAVTIEDMVYHTKAVTRGNSGSLVVTDLPFMAYKTGDVAKTITNAGKIIKEGHAQAVKLEGGSEIIEEAKGIINAGIPVMGHLGLTPQSVNQLGVFKLQAKTDQEAEKLLADAKLLETAGVFAIVLECIPAKLAARVTEELTIPTIGIGAGKNCDGQVLVTQDMLGMTNDFTPKFVRKYNDLEAEMISSIKAYKQDIEQGNFPANDESFTL